MGTPMQSLLNYKSSFDLSGNLETFLRTICQDNQADFLTLLTQLGNDWIKYQGFDPTLIMENWLKEYQTQEQRNLLYTALRTACYISVMRGTNIKKLFKNSTPNFIDVLTWVKGYLHLHEKKSGVGNNLMATDVTLSRCTMIHPGFTALAFYECGKSVIPDDKLIGIHKVFRSPAGVAVIPRDQNYTESLLNEYLIFAREFDRLINHKSGKLTEPSQLEAYARAAINSTFWSIDVKIMWCQSLGIIDMNGAVRMDLRPDGTNRSGRIARDETVNLASDDDGDDSDDSSHGGGASGGDAPPDNKKDNKKKGSSKRPNTRQTKKQAAKEHQASSLAKSTAQITKKLDDLARGQPNKQTVTSNDDTPLPVVKRSAFELQKLLEIYRTPKKEGETFFHEELIALLTDIKKIEDKLPKPTYEAVTEIWDWVAIDSFEDPQPSLAEYEAIINTHTIPEPFKLKKDFLKRCSDGANAAVIKLNTPS